MSPKVRAAIFIALALAWFGLAALSFANGPWYVGLIDLAAGAVMVAFAYRSTHPRQPSPDQIKPLRAPRPPR